MTATVDGAAAYVDAPVIDADPFSIENLTNPYELQEQIRETGPVVYLSKYDAYATGRFEIISEIIANWQDFISGEGVGLNEPWRTRGLLPSDPPEHDAPREVLQEILSARVLRSMQDQCTARASTLIDELLDGHGSGAVVEIDGVKDIASVFPVNFFPDASGIESEGREKLVDYADHIFNALGPRNELTKAGECPAKALNEWADGLCQRDRLAPEGFGADIWAAADRGEILHEYAPLLTRSLLTAGVDTTVYGISALLHAMAANPEQYQQLRNNPGMLKVAFDEALRVESPVQSIFRKIKIDVTLGGVHLKAGRRILMNFGAANRDPRRWENPDSFDLTRDPSGHLAFGMGVHQCVGQHAARLQATTLLEELMKRVESMELVSPASVEHAPNNSLRGWASVPIRVTLK